MSGLPRRRIVAAIFAFAVFSIYILARYAFLAGERAREIAAPRPAGSRGAIVDRNGRILAAEARRYDIHVRPPQDKNPEMRAQRAAALAESLAPILGLSRDFIAARIASADKEFVLHRSVHASVVDEIRAAQDRAEGRLSGVTARPVPFRVYPERSLAAQIVGFVGAQNEGLEGVEFAFNAALSGRDSGGAGSQVVLTIDANVQHILESVSTRVLRETGAESVMFMAMDPRTGDILGSAVVPGFDPGDIRSTNPSLFRNSVAMNQYEPGSVFKVFSVAALLEAGIISPQTRFYCDGHYERTFPGGETVRISCWQTCGWVTPREIISLSCNVGAARAAEMYDAHLFHRDLANFGFGSATGAWVNTETSGSFADPRLWSGRSRQSISFGQEIAVSALQVMQAATVIANEGKLVPPRIVSHVVAPDGSISKWENPLGGERQVVSARTAREVLGYMRDAATFAGTGWRADMADLNLAVKTGTAQILEQSGGYVSSALAILPAENPSLILYVVITKPQGETFSSRIAAPAIRDAAELIVDYRGIPRGRNRVVSHTGAVNVVAEVLPRMGAVVPDFTGLSKRSLLPLLLRDDINVEIVGEGWVRRQYPPPGEQAAPGMTLRLELE
ncbi:MAG: transpeptidase family protein [Treponema sp.]|nr:transpeptidase family protein [Treponema sp.]